MSDRPVTFAPDEHNQDPINQMLTDAGQRASTAINGAVYTKLLMDQWRLRKARLALDEPGSHDDLEQTLPPPPGPPEPPGERDRYAFAESPNSPRWDRDLQLRFDVLTAAPGSVVGHPASSDDGLIVGPLSSNGQFEVTMLSDNPPSATPRTRDELVTTQVRYDELVLLDNLGLGVAELRREDPAYDELVRLHPEALARYENLAARSQADIALGQMNDTHAAIAQGGVGHDPAVRDEQLERADVADGRADQLRASPGPPPMPPPETRLPANGAYSAAQPNPEKMHGKIRRRNQPGLSRHRRPRPGDGPNRPRPST